MHVASRENNSVVETGFKHPSRQIGSGQKPRRAFYLNEFEIISVTSISDGSDFNMDLSTSSACLITFETLKFKALLCLPPSLFIAVPY